MRVSVLFLLAAVVVCAVGCGEGPNRFFKPEISGAVYAAKDADTSVGDPTADDTAAHGVSKLTPPNWCYYGGPGVGWTCREDIVTEGGVWKLVDDDRFLAAPKFHPLNAP